MDEDQVNEEQGTNDPERQEVTFKQAEQDETPSRGMFSSVRRADPVNLYTFFGKQNEDVNERISVLERNLNTVNKGIAFNAKLQSNNFEKSLITIKTSILTLEQGLKVVSDKLDLSDSLRKIRDANEKKREQQLAEQQLREGKESLIEKKMQATLAAPLQKIGAKAQSVLGGLLKFFNTILLGIIGTRGIQVLGALISGNKEKLEEIKGKILKELGVATGIFLAINGGLAIALRSVIRLTGFIGRIAFTNLLARPLRRIFELASQGAFLRGQRPGSQTYIPQRQNRNRTNRRVTTQAGQTLSSLTSRRNDMAFARRSGYFASGLSLLNSYLSGEGPIESITRATAQGLTLAAALYITRNAPVAFQLASLIGAPVAVDAIVDNVFQGNELDNIQSQVQNRQLELRERANNVTVVGDITDETNVTGSTQVSDASALLAVASGNADNPYLINSYMQYNVVV